MVARRRALGVVAAAARAGKDLIENMTKPIPIPPPGPAAAELHARRPALLERIRSAAAQLAEAEAAYESDLRACTDPNDEKAIHDLSFREQRIKVCAHRRAELEQQLTAHDAATKAAERAEFERSRDVIQHQLADRTEAAELDRLEVEAHIATIDARLERIRYLERRVELQRALYNVQVKLAGEHAATFQSDSTVPSTVPIAEALRAHARTLPVEDPRRGLLDQLAFQLAPGLANVHQGAL